MEPYNFLQIESKDDTTNDVVTGGFNYPGSATSMPKARVNFILSDKIRSYERQAYSLIMLLGDIGGFQGLIIMAPALFMPWYSGQMY